MDYQTKSLLQAVRESVADAGGIKTVAAITGIGSLQQKLNPSCERNKLSIEDMGQILTIASAKPVLDVLCARTGAVWIDLSKLQGLACDSSMLENVTELVTRVGVLTRKVQESLEDGKVDQGELKELEAASLHLCQASMTVVSRAKQFMPKEELEALA